jgi:HlyD family secretion protein
MTEFEADLIASTSSMRRMMRSFILCALIFGLGIGGWAVAAKIDSAVVTAGTFEVRSNAQAVQHPEGGVIGAILVRDGDLVREGQILARLDAAKVSADMAILDRKLIDLTAEKARLDAERLDLKIIEPPALPISGRQAAVAYEAVLAAQQGLMNERRSTRASQLSQLVERKRQIATQIDGLLVKQSALNEEMTQASEQLADYRMLDSKGLIRRPILRQTERDVSRLRGDLGDTDSRVASARSQLHETELKIGELTQNSRSQILTELQAATAKLSEVQEQRIAAMDRFERLEIRAPRTGVVYELAIHTVGGVVSPGQKLMSIIPNSDPLIVSAKIKPSDVDQVHVGQRATVRVSAFKLPTTPELEGEVINVSPDRSVDGRSGESFFNVTVALEPGEQHKIAGKELTPGLPAEVLIRGEARRVIAYLVQPLADRLAVTFREE